MEKLDYVREHINEKDQPKKAFSSFEECWGYVLTNPELTGVFPYKCSICGEYHLGHPKIGDQFENFKSELNDLVRKNQDLESENQEARAGIMKKKINALNKEVASLRKEIEAISIVNESGLSVRDLQNQIKDKNHTVLTLKERLDHLKKVNSLFSAVLRSLGEDPSEIKKGISSSEKLKYLLKQIPEKLGNCKRLVIGKDSKTEDSKPKVKIIYKNQNSGIIEYSTPLFKSKLEAAQYLYDCWQEINKEKEEA